MITLTVSERIAKGPGSVFPYLSDPQNFPAWNSAVKKVSPLGGSEPAVGARYAMWRDLPTGKAENELEIVALDPPREFVLRTVSGPTPFVYRYRLAGLDEGGTELTLDAEADLGHLANFAGPIAGNLLQRGIEANLATLRGILG